jgi:hypothetical protein
MTDATPQTPELGPRTSGLLLDLFRQIYLTEIGSEEDVHRSLPFFGAALGLILAAVYYTAGKLPDWKSLTNTCPISNAGETIRFLGCISLPAIAAALILATLVTSGLTLYFLGIATRGRIYRRITESETVQLARELTTYHGVSAKWPGQIDNLVVTDLSDELIDQLVANLKQNRSITKLRYESRSRAISFLIWSLLIALFATIFMVATVKLGFPSAGEG